MSGCRPPRHRADDLPDEHGGRRSLRHRRHSEPIAILPECRPQWRHRSDRHAIRRLLPVEQSATRGRRLVGGVGAVRLFADAADRVATRSMPCTWPTVPACRPTWWRSPGPIRNSLYDWLQEDGDVAAGFMARWPFAVPFVRTWHLPWGNNPPPGVSTATALGVSNLLSDMVDPVHGTLQSFLTHAANPSRHADLHRPQPGRRAGARPWRCISTRSRRPAAGSRCWCCRWPAPRPAMRRSRRGSPQPRRSRRSRPASLRRTATGTPTTPTSTTWCRTPGTS